MFLNFEFRHGAKKLGHLDHPLQSYVKINFKYFIIFYKKLVCSGLPPAGSKTKIFSMICIGIFLACIQKIQKTGTPRKKCFFQKMWFFGGLGFSSVIFVNKPLKARCLSFKILYQHLLYLLSLWSYWHLKITQGPIRFWIGTLEGVKWQAAYNGPKQQCSGIRGFLPSMCLSGCWEIFSEKTRGALPAWVSKEAKEVEYQELFNLFDNFHSMTYLFYFNFGFFPIFFFDNALLFAKY